MAEYLYLGLRMSEGISEADFCACFGQELSAVYGEQIEELQRDGLLFRNQENGRISLTDYGMDVSNYVFGKFV